MLHNTKVEMHARDKHSNLLDWYVSYEENKTPDMLVNNEGCMEDKKKNRQQVVKIYLILHIISKLLSLKLAWLDQ